MASFKMRYGIFSDIHSNLEAFQSVISAYKKEKIDRYICAGDIVGYAANPSECIELTRGLTNTIVAGNHDWAAAGKFNTSYFSPNAKSAIEWTSQKLNLEEKDYLTNLTIHYKNQDLCLVHGALANPAEFDYILNLYSAKLSFSLLRRKVLFVGHSHCPGIFIKINNEIVYSQNTILTLDGNYQYIVNVGSVGQPRDADKRSCFCIFDTDKQLIEIKRVDYDIKRAGDKILKAGLPELLSTRLSLGK